MGIFDAIGGLFSGGGGSGPSGADAANPYLDKSLNAVNQGYDPYVNQGQSQYGQLSNAYSQGVNNPGLSQQYGSMANDPAAFLESIMKNYRPSQGYNLKRDEALRAAGNTAAAGGRRGDFNDMSNQSQISQSLMGNDMQQWLQNVMGIQGSGLSGQQHMYDTGLSGMQNLYNTGYNASSNRASDIGNIYGSKATNAFQDVREQNKSQSDLFGGLMSLAGGALGAFGGPLGSMAGSKVGSMLGGSLGGGQAGGSPASSPRSGFSLFG